MQVLAKRRFLQRSVAATVADGLAACGGSANGVVHVIDKVILPAS